MGAIREPSFRTDGFTRLGSALQFRAARSPIAAIATILVGAVYLDCVSPAHAAA